MLPDHKKERLRAPADAVQRPPTPTPTRSNGNNDRKKGKSKGKTRSSSLNAAPNVAETTPNDPQKNFKGLFEKCKNKGVPLCAAYVMGANMCRKGENCYYLHYNQSLADKAINAVNDGRELPMDLHQVPRNTVGPWMDPQKR